MHSTANFFFGSDPNKYKSFSSLLGLLFQLGVHIEPDKVGNFCNYYKFVMPDVDIYCSLNINTNEFTVMRYRLRDTE